jgi:hypothetical protein
MKDSGITRDQVRLKIGQRRPGQNYLDMKFMFIGAGTKGDDLWAAFRMLESLLALAKRFAGSSDYTLGYDPDTLGSQFTDLEAATGVLVDMSSSESNESRQELKDLWQEQGGDFGQDIDPTEIRSRHR